MSVTRTKLGEWTSIDLHCDAPDCRASFGASEDHHSLADLCRYAEGYGWRITEGWTICGEHDRRPEHTE